MQINTIIVTYGNRFNLLNKVLNAVLTDKNIDKVILVDNGSTNAGTINAYVGNGNLKEKIILIRNDKNLGSAGGFKIGILEAKKHECDYVLLLDDDNVLENNWSEFFANTLNCFPKNNNIILKGNRGSNFNLTELPSKNENIFKINYFKFAKIKYFFKRSVKIGFFNPIIHMPHGAVSYSGTLLPFKIIKETAPPLESFYLYCDDAEYFYRIRKSDYETYQTYRPFITDIDHTFSEDSQFLTSFDKNVSLIKLFFRVRNQYALALITKSQSKLSLIFNGIIGTFLKIMYAFIKFGINKFTIERAGIIIRAFCDGISLKFSNEENIKKYTR